MRRADRQVTSLDRITEIIDSQTHLHLAMTDGSQPYVVPMNYGYEITPQGALTLYLHCALEGKKLDILRRNPRVCFEISQQIQLVAASSPCAWTAKYRSVIGQGNAVIKENADDKRHALDALMRHMGYPGTPEYGNALGKVASLRIDVDSYTAKTNQTKEEWA